MNAVICEIEGGSALLDLNSSKYFKLNETASLLWQIIQGKPSSVDEIREGIMAEYDVDATQCDADVKAILGVFEKSGLIVRR